MPFNNLHPYFINTFQFPYKILSRDLVEMANSCHSVWRLRLRWKGFWPFFKIKGSPAQLGLLPVETAL
jgi:hypothetical protein